MTDGVTLASLGISDGGILANLDISDGGILANLGIADGDILASLGIADGDTLANLGIVFVQLSLLAFGGVNSIIPEMQRQVVDVHHWFDPRTFAALFALAQAAPGPNMMVVSLIGWNVAGVPGAVVATLAVAGPSSVLTWQVADAWYRFKDTPWRRAIQRGLIPVTAGLIMASAALLLHATAVDRGTIAIAVVTVCLFLSARLHPLLILGGAAALGALGVVG